MPDQAALLAEAEGLHHGSHADLLRQPVVPAEAPPDRRLDAIIVPTAWPADALRHAMQVGIKTECPVVALCSREAAAVDAIKIADQENAAVLAVDVGPSLAARLPVAATDVLLRYNGFGTTSDLSLKRNLGLVLASGAKWRRVLFLDDDIHVDQPEQLHRLAGLTDEYRAVGLANEGYQDNSVVCHAYRDVGGDQASFIGGGAMIVDAARSRSFFPNIYNEDWLFLLGDGVPFVAARAGVMRQRPYKPYANPARAIGEEVGDTLAEGLFWLLDGGEALENAGSTYWGDALFRRRRLIDVIIELAGPGGDRRRMRRSLKAARGRSSEITPGLCQEFVEVWQSDLARWGRYIECLTPCDGPEKFLHEVGMSHHVQYSKAYLNTRR